MREVIIQVSDKDFETYYKNDTKQELVRCRDCIYHDEEQWCMIMGIWTKEKWFCSCGMRWQDGTDGPV